MTQQILPQKNPYQSGYESLYAIWKIEHDATLPEFKIENIRFQHDPSWRDNPLSVQYVGDMERAVIKGFLQPYVTLVGFAEDQIFWAWFNYLDKHPPHRSTSLPPRLVPA